MYVIYYKITLILVRTVSACAAISLKTCEIWLQIITRVLYST
jgi:hypothetical protein